MLPVDSESNDRRFDVNAFWREHDRTLSRHKRFNETALSHDLYRGMPPWFNAFYAHFQRRAVQQLLRACVLSPGLRALDVGCGTGRWSGLMLSLGWKPYGVDVGEQALRCAAEVWREACFVCGMLPALCFADKSFALAISVTVLQHIPHTQQPEALQAIHRVLKPGGYLVICETIDTRDPSPHVFGNTHAGWRALFDRTGFRLAAVAGAEYLPYVRVFHWLRRWRKASPARFDVSAVARLLATQPLLAALVWFGIAVSYPLEYAALAILPARWARLNCFLLQKT